jgi:hypothetical protein
MTLLGNKDGTIRLLTDEITESDVTTHALSLSG